MSDGASPSQNPFEAPARCIECRAQLRFSQSTGLLCNRCASLKEEQKKSK